MINFSFLDFNFIKWMLEEDLFLRVRDVYNVMYIG